MGLRETATGWASQITACAGAGWSRAPALCRRVRANTIGNQNKAMSLNDVRALMVASGPVFVARVQFDILLPSLRQRRAQRRQHRSAADGENYASFMDLLRG